MNPEPGHLHVLGGVRETAVLGLPARRSVRARDRRATRPAGRPGSTSCRRGRSKSRWTTGSARYPIGRVDVTADMLHIRYQSSVDDAHGHGPLEAGQRQRWSPPRCSPATRPASPPAAASPPRCWSTRTSCRAEQAAELKAQWVHGPACRRSASRPSCPAASTWEADAGRTRRTWRWSSCSQLNESRIAVLLGVPPFLVGLPVRRRLDDLLERRRSIFDYHWRAGLRPKAQAVMAAPVRVAAAARDDGRGEPGRVRAARARTSGRRPRRSCNAIVDPATGQPAMTVDEIREAERLDNQHRRPSSQGRCCAMTDSQPASSSTGPQADRRVASRTDRSS